MKKYIIVLLIFFVPTITFGKIPDDPHVQQWAYEDIGLYDAWDLATGSHDVIVAVIDNGFDTFHPDFSDNIWINEDEIRDNGIDDDNNGYIDDVWGWNFIPTDTNNDGTLSEQELKGNNDPRPNVDNLSDALRKNNIVHHGTSVAGIIGARGGNGLDGAGVNWNVRLMNLKIIENAGVGSTLYLGPAIRYAVDNGADVINISLVGPRTRSAIIDAINYAYEHDVMIVSAAGNEMVNLNLSPRYPICSDIGQEEKVLGVSAIDQKHTSAIFSNVGSNCVNITAPGVDLSSTARFSPTNGLTKRFINGLSGTSVATPLVSGAAALIKSIQPTWGPSEIYSAILSTVHKTPPKDEILYTNYFGSGLIQIDKAVAYALSQAPKINILSRMTVINPADGSTETNTIREHSSPLPSSDVLASIDDISSFIHEGKRKYVSVKKISRRTSRVELYDSSWTKEHGWDISSSGKLRVVAGDILSGVKKPQIVISPAYADDQVFRVFDTLGNQIDEYSIDGLHAGVDIALVNAPDGKENIAAVYKEKNGVHITQFNRDMEPSSHIPVSFIKKQARLEAGDIDGDGLEEFVLSGGVAETPWVATYEMDGSLLRQFWGTDPGYTRGIEVKLGDYDQDGKDDIFILKSHGAEEITVMSAQVRPISSANISDKMAKNGLLLLVD